MLTHENLFFTGGAAHDAGHVPGVNRALATLPLSHAYGLLVTLAGMHSSERGVGRAAAVVRSRRVPVPDPGARAPAQRGRPVDAPDPARQAARGLRPVLAPVSELRRRSAGPRGGGGVRAPRPVGVDPPGLRPDRDWRTAYDKSGRAREARVGRDAGAGSRATDRRRRRSAAPRRERSARCAAARRE